MRRTSEYLSAALRGGEEHHCGASHQYACAANVGLGRCRFDALDAFLDASLEALLDSHAGLLNPRFSQAGQPGSEALDSGRNLQRKLMSPADVYLNTLPFHNQTIDSIVLPACWPLMRLNYEGRNQYGEEHGRA